MKKKTTRVELLTLFYNHTYDTISWRSFLVKQFQGWSQ